MGKSWEIQNSQEQLLMSIFSNKKMPEKLQQKKKREDRKREKNDKKERKIQNYTERKHKNIITKVLNLPPLAFDI